MKAAIYTRYGPPEVVQVKEVEKPVPKDDEVLLKIRAAAVNPADWRLLGGVPFIFHLLFGLRRPSEERPGKLGHDVAGVVEATGRNVTQLKSGDEVFGVCPAALAEYGCGSEARLVRKADGVTFEQAASVPVAALTALQGLRDKGHIRPGQKVLINGAAGGVGTFAVQLAKHFAAEVTGVCSGRNAEMVRALGADHVIDYAQEDFTRSGKRYDVILDNVGNHTLSECRRVLNPNGICVIAGAPRKAAAFFLSHMIAAPVLSRFGSKKFVMFIAKINKEDLSTVNELMATGKVTPVIDRRYSLREVPEALRYLEEGHARGKVVVLIS